MWREREPFWLRPLGLVSLVCGAATLLFIATPEALFTARFGTPRQQFAEVLGPLLLGYASLACGLICAQEKAVGFVARRQRAREDDDLIAMIGLASLIASLGSYAVYFLSAGVGWSDILAGLSGEPGASYLVRRRFQTIPGLTSFMNVAPLWFACLAYRWAVRSAMPSRLMVAVSLLLAGAVIARGIIGFERRAIVDLVLPALVVLVMLRPLPRGRLAVPLAAVFAVCALFVSTEYFRSWAQAGAGSGDPFLAWTLTRLVGYYATALNNGALALEADLAAAGSIMLGGVYRLPGLGDLMGLGDQQQAFLARYHAMLAMRANPEFNNPGGLLGAFIDFGWIGGSLALLVLGVAFGLIHARAARGDGLALLVYGLVVLSLLEITRVLVFLSPHGVLTLVWIGGLALVHRWWPRSPARLVRS